MNVLSLFDGISGGQLALQKAGIKVDNYFASEVDKHCIRVTQNNFPRTIQLGDVNGINMEDLPKIDLLLAGSPCQGFSFAGKQLNFEDERSSLFFQFVRLLGQLEPKWFLLENVPMKKEFESVISKLVRMPPMRINSKFFSAQCRERLYWSNIPTAPVRSVNYTTLENILEPVVSNDFYVSDTNLEIIIKSEVAKGKIIDLGCNMYNIHGRTVHVGGGLTTTYDALPCITPNRLVKRQNGRRFKPTYSKFYTLTASDIHGVLTRNKLRRLTPVEYERLQTIPAGYTACASQNQRYKMLGNSWTVDVIAHILDALGDEY